MTLSVVGFDHLVDPVLPLSTVEIMALAAVLARPSHEMLSGRLDYDDVGGGSDEAESAPGGRSAKVLPRQRDEFTCAGCYLVAHVSRQGGDGRCVDCR